MYLKYTPGPHNLPRAAQAAFGTQKGTFEPLKWVQMDTNSLLNASNNSSRSPYNLLKYVSNINLNIV